MWTSTTPFVAAGRRLARRHTCVVSSKAGFDLHVIATVLRIDRAQDSCVPACTVVDLEAICRKRFRPSNFGVSSVCPRQDSNLRHRLRRACPSALVALVDARCDGVAGWHALVALGRVGCLRLGCVPIVYRRRSTSEPIRTARHQMHGSNSGDRPGGGQPRRDNPANSWPQEHRVRRSAPPRLREWTSSAGAPASTRSGRG